jgi:hypothetical protein
MSYPDKTVITRPLNDATREVRIIQALYPQECLRRSRKLSDPHPTTGTSEDIPTYQNTGVQTLPPANGDVFRLIHGREPSNCDYTRNMGSAGIGRLANDPRSNPYDLIYGSPYPIPTTARRGAYIDSEFHTASHDMSRMALARAKVKASMTANKYRNAASQAGYVICAESRDEMVVHSEQFSNVVQLDADGNLLQGTVKTRSLPNIYGASVQPEPSEATTTEGSLEQSTGHLLERSRYKEHDANASQVTYPSQSPRIHAQATMVELQKPMVRVPALAPALERQTTGTTPTIDNEYGSGELITTEFVVYDAGAGHSRWSLARESMKVSPEKRKADEDGLYDQCSKKHKIAAQASSRIYTVFVAPLAVTPPKKPDQDRTISPLTPDSDPSKSRRSSTVGTCDFVQERALSLARSSIKSRSRFESIAPSSTDAPRTQDQKLRREGSSDQRNGYKGVIFGTGAGSSCKAKDHMSDRQTLTEQKSPRPTKDISKPIIPPAESKAKRRISHGKDTELLHRS